MSFKPNRMAKGFMFATLGIGALFGITYVVMLLWNALLPEIIHVETITYWQSMGILVLSKILFGGFKMGGRGSYGRGRWKEKFANMTEEEKAAFKEKMKQRCGIK